MYNKIVEYYWEIIDKFTRISRHQTHCGAYINDDGPLINKPVKANTEKDHTSTWAIIILTIFVLKMVKGILQSY